MKSALLVAIATAAALVAAEWKPGGGGVVMWDSNCDFFGHDLEERLGGAELCGEYCVNNPACSHWAWNDYNGGTCWLKQGRSNTKRTAPGLGCGYVVGRFDPNNNGGGHDDHGSGASDLARLFNAQQFHQVFDPLPLYSYDGLVTATQAFPDFATSGNFDADKRELAAFLAQTAHESGAFRAEQEGGWQSYPIEQYCDRSLGPCAPGRRYHGRGPMQLSWNYNYKAAGDAFGVDLWSNPDLVLQDSVTAWRTAIWFWMTPQKQGRVIHNVIHSWDGFAQATDIINGGQECGPSAPHREKEWQRIAYYKQLCQAFGIDASGKLSCN